MLKPRENRIRPGRCAGEIAKIPDGSGYSGDRGRVGDEQAEFERRQLVVVGLGIPGNRKKDKVRVQ